MSAIPPEREGPVSGSRPPVLAGSGRRSIAALLGVAAVVGALRAVVRTGEEGGRTLGFLSAPMTALAAAGEHLSRFGSSRGALLAGVLLGAAGLALWAAGRRIHRLPAWGPSLFLLAAALLLFPGTPAVSAAFGLAAGVALAGLAGEKTEEPGPSALWLLLPVTAGFVLRSYALGLIPAGFSSHAVYHHVKLVLPFFDRFAGAVAEGGARAVPGFLLGTLADPTFPLYVGASAAGYPLFGIGLTAARATSAFLGTVTIVVAYLAGTALASRRLGLTFAFLLALSPWHVTISRYPDTEHILSPLHFLLVVWLLASAYRRGRWRDYLALAGTLALGWYVYSVNHAVPLLVALFGLYKLVTTPSLLRRDGWKMAAAAAVFAAVGFAPLRAFVESGRLAPNFRTGYDAHRIDLSDASRLRTMLAGAGTQLFREVGDPWFGKPGGGLGQLEAALFVPAAVLALAGLRSRRTRDAAVLVLLALPVSLLPGVLSPEVTFRRFFLTATVILLMGSCVLVRWAKEARAAGLGRRALTALVLGAVTLQLAAGVGTYFREVRVENEESCRFAGETAKIARDTAGSEFLLVVVPEPAEEFADYLRFAARDALRRDGGDGSRLWEVASCASLFSRLEGLPQIGGKTRILVDDHLLREPARWCDGRDPEGEISRRFPGREKTAVTSPRGDVVLGSWRLEPGAP